jgi:hypothetical protein
MSRRFLHTQLLDHLWQIAYRQACEEKKQQTDERK